MMQGSIDLLESERGVFALLILIAATVLAVMGTLPINSWLELVKWLAVTLIASKTVTTAVQAVVDKKGRPGGDGPKIVETQ
jgi:threonine/homoserine efflux transporter RhtA